MYYHQTIKRYLGTVLHILNTLEVQYQNSQGDLCQKNIPVLFTGREKSDMFNNFTEAQLLKGNVNLLPRGYLQLEGFGRNAERHTNKNVKVNIQKNSAEARYQFNSIPFDFNFNGVIRTRGMSEATMIAEELAGYFNPVLSVDIFDADYEDSPTAITMKLDSLNITSQDLDAKSHNIYDVEFKITLYGWIYQPVRSQGIIKEFIMHVYPEQYDDHFTIGYDVETGKLKSQNYIDKTRSLAQLELLSIDVLPVQENEISWFKPGENKVTVKYKEAKHNSGVLKLSASSHISVEPLDMDDTKKETRIQTFTVWCEEVPEILKVELTDEYNNKITTFRVNKNEI